MSLLQLIFEGKPAAEVLLRPSIDKNRALLCLDAGCEAIFEAGSGGPGVADTCPRCGGGAVWPIAKGLDRQSEEVAS